MKNINQIVNCNSIETVDGSKWIEWYLDKKKSISQEKLDTIVFLLQDLF